MTLKKILLVILIFWTTNVFGQKENSTLRKHPWAVDFGVTYNYEDKNDYHFGSQTFFYGGQITPFPGYYSYSTASIHASIIKNFNFLKYFYFGSGIMYYNDRMKHYSPPDTILKYLVFPDSLKENMTFFRANLPIHNNVNLNNIRLSFSLSFQYKRFVLFIRQHISLTSFEFYNNTYLNNIKKKYFTNNFLGETYDNYKTSLGLQSQIIKNKPLYLYIILNGNYLLGFEYRF